MRRFIYIMTLSAALAGCSKDYDCDCSGGSAKVYPNMNIGDVRALYSGSPSAVNEEAIIAGNVTANDLSGNFYRTFIMEDATGAIEVRAGLYDLKNLFPEGRYVAVRAKGLTVSDYNGVLQIGLAPSGGSRLPDYFGHRVILDKYVYRGSEAESVVPQVMAVHQLKDDMCGRLVKVEGLTFRNEGVDTWASQDGFTSYSLRTFEDGDGRTISVSTSKYASFAGSAIPATAVTVTGILTKEPGFSLRIRTLGDVVED